MKIALVTSPNQWFYEKALEFAKKLGADFFEAYEKVRGYEVVFILSYHKIIPPNLLSLNQHNLIIHASKLPQGKGWSPMFYQILEGKNDIVFTLFEADKGVDSGDIYLQKTLKLRGDELYEELRNKQAFFSLELCEDFLKLYPNLKSKKQNGAESFYPKRSPKDSELNIDKSLKEQFNLLRICSNEDFPAFFYHKGKKFVLKIYEEI
ncbi:methionyl-tRNA formyltransferase [Campylobacter upsaliensis]|nr:methionyl-tRNA formyltransferase [Campylobacter upsaliensis]EAL4016574.1 methionyl-tRNA formyltransferase [Campylobacter upsaliensis]